MHHLEADYVIVGSGAVGMAFADVILAESDASMVIIDRYAKPGGHWNLAYPFVTLHQPASFYGVSSKELSGGRLEQGGLNDGLGELSSGAAVSAYFDDVMRHTFLPSGRVQYFPMCDYRGDGHVVNLISGEQYQVTAIRKLVDATFLKTTVPKTHTPNFEVADGVRFMPLNDLPSIREAPDGYVVIGGGKTGIDACLWLLEQGVDPARITWVVSREAWLLDRRNTQMTPEFFFTTMETQARMYESIARADSPEDMFDRLEACGYFLRIDQSVQPEMFHGATVSHREIEELRRITDVVRLGHVTAITPDEVALTRGAIPTTRNTVHVDCSASAIVDPGAKPIFQGNLITPQLVRPYQPVFSSALVAHVELAYADEETKNRLCGLVPLPDTTDDFIRFTAAALVNQYHWGQDKPLRSWIAGNRLDGAGTLMKSVGEDDEDKRAIIHRIREAAPLAAAKLLQFQAAMEAPTTEEVHT
ncbi:NAD(P)/FAD-dependent oxidoreductase [Euzebya tangerina]|uniref:NAD(P)/FAD-dependent oxidoreductase n=1 Tax=Euzebya tangerina TaxID=591198 RepID=UPI000E3216A5|nr:NAD(P)/FAD-dependent oxidoreductase [Euzebya tangerina]